MAGAERQGQLNQPGQHCFAPGSCGPSRTPLLKKKKEFARTSQNATHHGSGSPHKALEMVAERGLEKGVERKVGEQDGNGERKGQAGKGPGDAGDGGGKVLEMMEEREPQKREERALNLVEGVEGKGLNMMYGTTMLAANGTRRTVQMAGQPTLL